MPYIVFVHVFVRACVRACLYLCIHVCMHHKGMYLSLFINKLHIVYACYFLNCSPVSDCHIAVDLCRVNFFVQGPQATNSPRS